MGMAGSFVRWCGLALCVAAVTTLALNIFVSPHLPDGAFATVAASQVYFLRQCIASIVALLLIFGIAGIHVGRLGRVGLFGTIAFVSAFTGQVQLFAIEYGQAFQIHDYALNAPAMLNAAMADPHRPLAIGALIAVAGFFLGWMLLAISLLVSWHFARWGPALIVVGLPLLFVTKSLGAVGGMITSAVTGAGWLLIGLEMMRRRTAS
jgi:hypothetical protein